MVEEGLLKGAVEDLVKEGNYKKYYPHNIGHWLGSDVHDAGISEINGGPRVFEPGMCFTIEPGIYIPGNDESAPEELRGIGIRIEDNIVVTESGYEVMTEGVPKAPEEMEALIGG